MSTKKDKFTSKDRFYMELALDLAKSRHGQTGSNPSVGCVIVKNDKIICTTHREITHIMNYVCKITKGNHPK